MTWKKLLAGGAGFAFLAAWGVSLSNCTVCSGPQCFNGDDSGTGTDTGTGNETSVTDSGTDGAMMGCPSIKPQGPLYWDNPQGTGACDMCMAAKCCTEATACVNQIKGADGSMDTCDDYMNCIDVCNEPDGGTCTDACNQTDPMGKPTGQALITCRDTKCTTECM